MIIEPLNMPYPIYEKLSAKQKSTYDLIKLNIDHFEFTDVEDQYSYIMLYLNELIQKLLTSDNSCNFYIDRINFVKRNYLASFLQDYCSIWLGDMYFYFDDYNSALSSWVSGLRPENIWTLLASKILSLKLQLDIPISAHEALSYKKNITKYGKNNMDLVIKYVDTIIKEDYFDGSISTEYFLESDRIIETNAGLFSGCVFGYDINAHYNSRINPHKCLHIESLPNFTSYVSDLSRRAENAIREDLELPRIGEGWISETDLYYKIKKHFSTYTVIQHFNADWLGKQHLDVYIKELNVGIEFHGLQHFQPVDFFGGQEAFVENQKRDKKKIAKCKKNSTKLVVVKDGYNIDALINEIENLTTAST